MIQIESRLTKARVEPVEKPGENGARLVHKRIRFLAALSFSITSQFFFKYFLQEHDDSECWSETPEYFRQVAWPGYLSNRQDLR